MKIFYLVFPIVFLLSGCGTSSIPGAEDVNGYIKSPCACGPVIQTPNKRV